VELRKYIKGRFTHLEKKVEEASTGLTRRRSTLHKSFSRASLDSIRLVAKDETSCDVLSDKDADGDTLLRRSSRKPSKTMTSDRGSATAFRSALDESVSQMLAAHVGEMATLQAEITQLQQVLLRNGRNEEFRNELCVRCGQSRGNSRQISDSENSSGGRLLSKQVVCQDRAPETSNGWKPIDGHVLRPAPRNQDELSCVGVMPMVPPMEAQRSDAACGPNTCSRSFLPGASGSIDGSRSGAPKHSGFHLMQDL